MRSWFRTLLFCAAFLTACLIGWAVVAAAAFWAYTRFALWLNR